MKEQVNVCDFLKLYLLLFAPIILLLSGNCSETDIQYTSRKKERKKQGRWCSHHLSLHPSSLSPSVTVIFERLDWRQWPKRERETCCHSCTLFLSLYMLPAHLPHSLSPHYPALKLSALQLLIYLTFLSLCAPLSFHLSLATVFCFSVHLVASISGLSVSSTVSLPLWA